jgi:hypothetical protein
MLRALCGYSPNGIQRLSNTTLADYEGRGSTWQWWLAPDPSVLVMIFGYWIKLQASSANAFKKPRRLGKNESKFGGPP